MPRFAGCARCCGLGLQEVESQSHVRLSEKASPRGLDLHPNGSLFTNAIAKGSCRGRIK